MKVHIRILLLASVLAGFVWLGFLSSAQQLPTHSALAPTNEDLPLSLNGEPVGSMANTRVLEARLQSLKAKVDNNFNSGGEALPNIGRLVLVPDQRLSFVQIGRLWDKLDEFFDYPVFERMALSTGACDAETGRTASKSGPTFVLSNSPIAAGDLDKLKMNGCWIDTHVIKVSPSDGAYATRLLRSYRTAVTSMEVTQTGGYFLNEQVKDERFRASPTSNLDNPKLRRKVDAATVTQRPITSASLKKEIDSWIIRRGAEDPIHGMSADEGIVELPVIVSGMASYDALSQILKFIGNEKVRLMVVIDDRVAAKPMRANKGDE